MNQRAIYLLAGAAAIVLLLGLVVLRPAPEIPKEPVLTEVITPMTGSTDNNAPLVGKTGFSRSFREEPLPPDEEIERLQEFLDANDNEAIVEQARFLAESEDPRRREEAIDALVWVSTPQAGMALLPLLRDQDEETSQAALSAMSHILSTIGTRIYDDSETGELVSVGGGGDDDDDDDTGLSDEDLQENYDLWVAACVATNDADDLEMLLIQLTGLDVKFSVPVLLDVMDKTTDEKHEKAVWYLDVATNSDGVTNREEAMLWLQEQTPE